jgi:N-acetylglucosaminyldiphosphoundecaprenol N-acetyl-beta-D-mannosaminyltransferase
MTNPPATIDFLGLPISDLDDRAAAALIAARPEGAPYLYVVTPNAHHIVRLSRDDGVWRRAYRGAWLRLSDGHVVWRLARLILGIRLPHASGSDVTMLLVKHFIRPEDAITVIGGGAQLEKALIEQYGWRNLALFDPPPAVLRNEQAQRACIDFVAAHPARYVFFAIGAPQSEWLAAQAAERGGLTGTGLCIGSSLLFATGLVRRAPQFIRRLGLEGLFRLAQRPRSHFRRLFVDSLPILWLLLRARFKAVVVLPPDKGEA